MQEVSKQLEAGDVYLLTLPLLLPTPLDQLCIEDFAEVPSLGPKP